MICINCKNEHSEKFCPNCGQKSEVQKITFRSILNDAFSTVTNMDKGLLFNVKSLLLNPEEIVNDYILGKRKHIFNPISFLIITISIYLIVDSLIVVPGQKQEIDSQIYSVGYEAGKFIKNNFKYFWILSIIWLSFSTRIIFRQYNYAEHLAVNSFVIGQATLAGLIGFVLFRQPLLFNPIIYIFITWMIYKIHKAQGKKLDVFFQSVAATLLFFIQLLLITVFIGIIGNYNW